MAKAQGRLLHQVAVEVRYKRGFVFFDRCGSLMLRLEEELGAPFKGTVPTMQFGQLQSAAEFLTVQYGPDRMTVTQLFASTIARVEQVAPRAWGHVGESLSVEREVSRYGVRFWQMWPVETASEADARLAESNLFGESAEWSSVFGKPTKRSFSAIHVSQDERSIRAELSVSGTTREGSPLPEELERRAPPIAILLDLDFHLPPEEGRVTLHPTALKEFIRSSWEKARQMADSVDKFFSKGSS